MPFRSHSLPRCTRRPRTPGEPSNAHANPLSPRASRHPPPGRPSLPVTNNSGPEGRSHAGARGCPPHVPSIVRATPARSYHPASSDSARPLYLVVGFGVILQQAAFRKQLFTASLPIVSGRDRGSFRDGPRGSRAERRIRGTENNRLAAWPLVVLSGTAARRVSRFGDGNCTCVVRFAKRSTRTRSLTRG